MVGVCGGVQQQVQTMLCCTLDTGAAGCKQLIKSVLRKEGQPALAEFGVARVNRLGRQASYCRSSLRVGDNHVSSGAEKQRNVP